MKKRHQAGKRIAAWLMALSLCMTAVPAEQVVYAAGGQNETEVTELTELTEVPESAEAMKDSETTEKTGAGEKAETEEAGTESKAFPKSDITNYLYSVLKLSPAHFMILPDSFSNTVSCPSK